MANVKQIKTQNNITNVKLCKYVYQVMLCALFMHHGYLCIISVLFCCDFRNVGIVRRTAAAVTTVTTLPGHNGNVAPLARRALVVTWLRSRGGTTRTPPSQLKLVSQMTAVRWKSPTASVHSAADVTSSTTSRSAVKHPLLSGWVVVEYNRIE